MGRSGRRFRLGLFVLGTGGLFLALVAFIASRSLHAERVAYFILFAENVKGMVVGSKVNFQGVPIGVVGDIRFQDGKTLVELRVDPTRACIQDLSTARMDRLLVTGQVTIELEGYGPKGKPLPPGSFIKPREDPLHSLTGSIPEVVDRAADVLARLDGMLVRAEILLGDENQAKVSSILDHLAAASGNLANASGVIDKTVVPEALALLQQARTTAAQWGSLQPEMTAFAREATALAASLRGPVQQALAGLRQTLDDVRALARQLKLAPDSLLFGVQRPAAPAGGER